MPVCAHIVACLLSFVTVLSRLSVTRPPVFDDHVAFRPKQPSELILIYFISVLLAQETYVASVMMDVQLLRGRAGKTPLYPRRLRKAVLPRAAAVDTPELYF